MKRSHLFKDLTGQTFGYLTPLFVDEVKSTPHHIYWVCECVCGKRRSLQTHQLTSGKVTSCGCKNARQTKRSDVAKAPRMYSLYISMLARCHAPNSCSYPYYGAKGIKVCEEWRNSFASFREWSFNNGYNDSLSIDRIDNSKGYEPSNCRWVEKKEQGRNKTNNVWITHNSETHIMAEWCEIIDFPYALAKSRSRMLKQRGLPLTFENIFRDKGIYLKRSLE